LLDIRVVIGEAKKTIVFLGTFDKENKPAFSATGFLLRLDSVFHLATAKHVVVNPLTDKPRDGLMAFYNRKDGVVAVTNLQSLIEEHEIRWVFHADPLVDVALIPFPLNVSDDDVKTIPETVFKKSPDLFELDDVFFLSYQPGLEPHDKIRPVVRSGSISLLNADGTFYIDAAAFPGNSGSPVFLKPSLLSYGEGTVAIGGPDDRGGRFVGIVGEYVPYQEWAISSQTNRPRVVFEENTGLSRIWSADFLGDIISSADFKDQTKRLQPKVLRSDKGE